MTFAHLLSIVFSATPRIFGPGSALGYDRRCDFITESKTMEGPEQGSVLLDSVEFMINNIQVPNYYGRTPEAFFTGSCTNLLKPLPAQWP